MVVLNLDLKHSCVILTLYFHFKTPGVLERVTQERKKVLHRDGQPLYRYQEKEG
jgi:hypothetical protein